MTTTIVKHTHTRAHTQTHTQQTKYFTFDDKSWPFLVSVPRLLPLSGVNQNRITYREEISSTTRNTSFGATNTREYRYVRMGSGDAGPVHGLQRCALGSAVPCAKLLERFPATRVHVICQLVHAIAGLQAAWCRSTDIYIYIYI